MYLLHWLLAWCRPNEQYATYRTWKQWTSFTACPVCSKWSTSHNSSPVCLSLRSKHFCLSCLLSGWKMIANVSVTSLKIRLTVWSPCLFGSFFFFFLKLRSEFLFVHPAECFAFYILFLVSLETPDVQSCPSLKKSLLWTYFGKQCVDIVG